MNATYTMSHCAGWLHIPTLLAWLLYSDGSLAGVAGCPAGLLAIVDLVRSLAFLI